MTQPNKIDFGSVEIHEKAVRVFNIINTSENTVEYNWNLKDASGGSLTVTPETGTIQSSKRARCTFTYQPQTLGRLPPSSLTMKVTQGDTYHIDLIANSVPPGVHFRIVSK